MEYLYVEDEAIERDAEIRFETREKVWGERIRKLHRKLEEAADVIGGTYPDIVLPPKGFLKNRLNEAQQDTLNRHLAQKYAERNIRQQQELLHVEIQECGEEMVSLKDVLKQHDADATYSKERFHDACGLYANKKRIWFVRKAVAHKMAAVIAGLNQMNIIPRFEDCYRPPEVQKGLYIRRLLGTAILYPHLSREGIIAIASSFTASIPGLAGHQAGAAIDLRFASDTGALYEIGNDYASGTILSDIQCPYVTSKQFYNRMLFASTMRMGGFKLLPTENWHVSHGDRGLGIDGLAAASKKVFYGPLKSFLVDEKGCELVTYKVDEADKPHLSQAEIDIILTIAQEQPTADITKLLRTFEARAAELFGGSLPREESTPK